MVESRRGYRRGYSRKGRFPCVRGEVLQLPLGRKRLCVCMLVYVCFREIPCPLQFYMTKCQPRKLRHVMFCNICIKNPNLRKILIFLRFIGLFGRKKPTAASREDAVGFDPICGMHVGLQGFNCLVLCGFINSIPHKVRVTVSGIPAQTGSYPILKRRTQPYRSRSYFSAEPVFSAEPLRFFAPAQEAARDATLEPAEVPVASAEPG